MKTVYVTHYFIEEGSVDVGEVTHRPLVGSSDFHFICDQCGETAVTKETA